MFRSELLLGWLAPERTGIELVASVGERALVVHLNAVATLRLPVTFNLLRDIYLQLGGVCGQGTESGGGHESQGEEVTHFR